MYEKESYVTIWTESYATIWTESYVTISHIRVNCLNAGNRCYNHYDE